MQSFYLTNRNENNLNLNILDSYLNKTTVVANNFNINFFYSDKRESIIKKDKSFIANLGVFIYKNRFNKEALKFLLEDLEKGENLEDILLSDYTRGQFCLILFLNNKLQVITDRLGYYPVYLYRKGNNISMSNAMLGLAKNNKNSLNKIGVAQYLSENYKHITYACCDQNITNEITYLEPGAIYSLENNDLKQHKYFYLKEILKIGKYKSFDEVLEKTEKILSENLSFLKNFNGEIHSDVTGGVDTRVVLAILKHLNINHSIGIQAITEYDDFSNYGKFSEINIVKKILDYRKQNFYLFSEDDYLENQKLIDNITFFHSHKQTYNRRTGYFFNIRNKGKDILTSGLSGTELLRLSYYDYFKRNDKIDLENFHREYVELVDILHDDYLSENKYYEHLKDFYSKNLSGINHKKDKDLSSYIDYFAFYRTHFCRYLSLANSFLPFYTPYGDYPFASFMYQVSYDLKKKFKIQRHLLSKIEPELASFNSTRGFPLEKVSFFNFYKFSRMISNNIPQQYFSIRQKMSTFYKKKLINFLFENRKIYDTYFKKKKKDYSKRKNLWNTPDQISVIEDLENLLKKDLPVFEIVSRKKLVKYTKQDCNYNVINRVINLNRILEYINY